MYSNIILIVFFVLMFCVYTILLFKKIGIKYTIMLILSTFITVLFTDPRELLRNHRDSLVIIPIENIIANFTLLEIILFPIMIAYILLSIFQKKPKINKYIKRIFHLWIIFLIIIFVSITYALNKFAVIKEFLKWLEVGITATAIYLYINDLEKLKNVYWFLFMSYLFWTIGIFLANLSFGTPWERIYASIDSAIILLLPFLKKTFAKRLILLLIPFLILSYSRLAWFNVLLAIFFITWQYIYRKKLITSFNVLILLVIISILIITIPSFRDIFLSRISYILSGNYDQSTNDRIAFYIAGLIAWKDNPLHGIGAGNFKSYLLKYDLNTGFKLKLEILPSNPHSTLLQLLTELGLIGIIVFIVMVVLFFKVLVLSTKSIKFIEKIVESEEMNYYARGIGLHAISFITLLFTSYIGMMDRILWGIYFGLVFGLFKIITQYKNSVLWKNH
jgi:O-antigen ligase